MTTTRTLHITSTTDLSGVTSDTLGRLYGKYDAQAHAAAVRERALYAKAITGRRSPAGTRAMNLRHLVGEEASRRGLIIRRLWDGVYACGRPADFEPCEQAA